MNEKQLNFLNSKPYLVRAFEQITEEDIKEELQNICKKMTQKMTFKEKATFWKDLMILIKLWHE